MHLKEVDANLLVILDALLVDASVTRAAERLGRSASAISHALAKLREIFADELFVRAGQKLVPTAKAIELAPTVHVILAGMESLLRPTKPFDPSDTERDFAIVATETVNGAEFATITFKRQTAAANLTQQIDYSTDLIVWQPGSSYNSAGGSQNGVFDEILNLPGPHQTIKLRDIASQNTESRRFYRITTQKP